MSALHRQPNHKAAAAGPVYTCLAGADIDWDSYSLFGHGLYKGLYADWYWECFGTPVGTATLELCEGFNLAVGGPPLGTGLGYFYVIDGRTFVGCVAQQAVNQIGVVPSPAIAASYAIGTTALNIAVPRIYEVT